MFFFYQDTDFSFSFLHNCLINIIKRLVKYLETAIEMLGDTGISAELKAIYDFYNTVQSDFDYFKDEFSLSCPDGCGECCAHFIPDVTQSEALLLAARVLFGEKKSLLQERLKASYPSKIVCPFFDLWSDHHCMVYSSRPLICRMFYSCASSGKDGSLAFGGCRFCKESRSISSEELSSSDCNIHPMGDYGEMLEVLPGNSPATELLPEAVTKAINRIGYALNLLFPENSSLIAEDQGA